MAGQQEKIIVPRNFKLLEELENAEKGKTSMEISFGLADQSDITLTEWQCTILGPMGSPVEGRIVSLLLKCDNDYPTKEPIVQFQTKMNYPFIVSLRFRCFFTTTSRARAACRRVPRHAWSARVPPRSLRAAPMPPALIARACCHACAVTYRRRQLHGQPQDLSAERERLLH